MSGKLVEITDRVLDGWALGQLGNLLKEVVSWTLDINQIYQNQKGGIESYKTLIKEGGSKQVHLSSPIRSQGFSCLGFYNCVSRSHSQAGKGKFRITFLHFVFYNCVPGSQAAEQGCGNKKGQFITEQSNTPIIP